MTQAPKQSDHFHPFSSFETRFELRRIQPNFVAASAVVELFAHRHSLASQEAASDVVIDMS